MQKPIPFVGIVKRQVEQDILIAVARGWEGWVSRAARMRRWVRYNHLAAEATATLGHAVALLATGSVMLIGPLLTRGENK